jgi:hypothetical protein
LPSSISGVLLVKVQHCAIVTVERIVNVFLLRHGDAWTMNKMLANRELCRCQSVALYVRVIK